MFKKKHRNFLIIFLLLIAIGWLSFSSTSYNQDLLIIDMVGKNPGEKYIESSFNDPTKLKSYGYNGQVKRDFITGAVTFDALNKEVFPEGSAARNWVLTTENRIREQISEAKKAGIKIYYFTDIIILPKRLKELYKDQILDAKGNISFQKDKTREIHKIMIEEIFQKFPEVDGLVIRTGENYVYDLPYHVGNSPIDAQEAVKSHAELLKFLREEVCVKKNKEIIYRTWSLDAFHSNPEYYLSVTDQIEPHENLLFSIKHVSGDFFRTISFNQTIGKGDHRQIVEVQCQREYEGKGAHPNYIADGVINGFEEFDSFKQKLKSFLGFKSNSLNDIKNHKNFAGVWTWSRGGGWYGPYIKNELWCELNAYVISQWVNSLNNGDKRSEEEIFNQYWIDHFGLQSSDIQKVRKINLLASKGILKGHYSENFHVPLLWTRDDFFGGMNDLKETFTELYERNMIEEALVEKQESEEIWNEILSIALELEIKDLALKDFIVGSCEYGKIKYSIINQAWIIMLNGFKGEKTGVYKNEIIQEAIEKYDNYWVEFETLEKRYSSSSSIYRPFSFVHPEADGTLNKKSLNNGMKKSIDRYR